MKDDNVNNLEDLLTQSRRLNSRKCSRLIDQQIENLSINKSQSIQRLILSCNKIGKSDQFNWTQLPKSLQVFIIVDKSKI